MQNKPVLEREAELAALSRARKRAGNGRGGWITVTGPAGIGKTCLLEQVAAEATAAGWFVLEARSPRSSPDHSILLEMLDGLDRGAAPLDGPARALSAWRRGSARSTRDLALGLRWLLDDLVAHQPTLLLVDDLETGDAVSLRVLRAIRDDLRLLRCLVVAAVTDGPAGTSRAVGTTDLVRDLVAGGRRLTPMPLSAHAVATLVRSTRPGADDDEIDVLHRQSAGYPGTLRDLLDTAADQAGTPASPTTTRDLAATPAEPTTLGALEHAAEAADALADAGRVAEASAAYADLVALVAVVAPDDASWLHDRRLLAAAAGGLDPLGSLAPVPLAPTGADPSARLATAVSLAHRGLSARRVRSLALRAVREVAAGALPARTLLLSTTLLGAVTAFDEAEEVLTGILDSDTDHPARLVATACRGHLRIRAGLVNKGLADLDRAAAGDGPQAAADLSAVIEGRLARGEVTDAARVGTLLAQSPLTSGLGAALARHARGEVASAIGDNAAAIDHFHEAGRRLGPGIDNPALLAWRVGAAFAEIRSGSPARALTLARDNLRLAQRFGAPYAEAQALRTLAAVDVAVDRISLLRQALVLVTAVPAPRLRAQITTDLAALLMLTDGGEVEALTLLREVDVYAATQELWPLQARVRRLLVRLGAVSPRRHAEALSTLTASERRTARLAAEGRTNRQIAEQTGVSVKAVEWHLSGCYRKLGIRSRRQLPSMLGAA
ncbi:MAG: LuxR family transcriptional regulator [Nocardioides sp.]